MMQKPPDYFAGQALRGLVSYPYNPTQIAERAWAISDAMMIQRGIRRESRYDADMGWPGPPAMR